MSIALRAVEAARPRDEPTEREPAESHFDFGGQRLVRAADRPGAGDPPGDERQIYPAGPFKTGHSAARLGERERVGPEWPLVKASIIAGSSFPVSAAV